MGFVARMALATVLPVLLAAGTGCRRAGPSLADDHPGIEPKPSGRALGENLPMPDPERPTIDLSRPESLGRSLDPSSEDDVAYEAAMRGEAWAQASVGSSYADSEDPIRLQLGIEFLEAAASAGNADALFKLAKLSLAGRGMERSPAAAFDYMRRAAELGLPDAEYELASMYSEGRGTAKDPEAALQWARKAAANSHPKATVAVGMIMLQSEDTATQSKGLEMVNQAAASGNKEAALSLATAYARGDQGVAKDEKRAEELLKPQAQAGDAESEFALASLYQFGETFAARRKEAQEWLRRAADQGHPKALEILRSEETQRPAELSKP